MVLLYSVDFRRAESNEPMARLRRDSVLPGLC